jgi:hypothetical protein
MRGIPRARHPLGSRKIPRAQAWAAGSGKWDGNKFLWTELHKRTVRQPKDFALKPSANALRWSSHHHLTTVCQFPGGAYDPNLAVKINNVRFLLRRERQLP